MSNSKCWMQRGGSQIREGERRKEKEREGTAGVAREGSTGTDTGVREHFCRARRRLPKCCNMPSATCKASAEHAANPTTRLSGW